MSEATHPHEPSPNAAALNAAIRRFLAEAERIHEYPRSYDMGHLKQLASAVRRRAEAQAAESRSSGEEDAALEMRRFAIEIADAVMPMTHENARAIIESVAPMARELSEMVETRYPTDGSD